jgi:hypothetical protein
MDADSLEWFRTHLEVRFLKARREQFQQLVCDVLERRYLGDFKPPRQGTAKGGGDGGCDRFRSSTGTAYALYAPRETSYATLKSKIEGDLRGQGPDRSLMARTGRHPSGGAAQRSHIRRAPVIHSGPADRHSEFQSDPCGRGPGAGRCPSGVGRGRQRRFVRCVRRASRPGRERARPRPCTTVFRPSQPWSCV